MAILLTIAVENISHCLDHTIFKTQFNNTMISLSRCSFPEIHRLVWDLKLFCQILNTDSEQIENFLENLH